MGRPFRPTGRADRGCAALVRGYIHGQHADGVSLSTVWLFAILFEKRCAPGNYDGHNLPCGSELYGAAMARTRALASLPVNRALVTQCTLCALGGVKRSGSKAERAQLFLADHRSSGRFPIFLK